jgi:rfaE bifunctional protein kinase chain/domain
MGSSDIIRLTDNFAGKKIGVIGDFILDRYVFGDVERISPEAPIPVVVVSDELFSLGGAGNVANNIAALGGEVFALGLLGEDEAGEQLLDELRKRHIDTSGIIRNGRKHTTQKMRVVARGQHIVRVDKEDREHIDKRTENKLSDFLRDNIDDWDCLAISDYAKGVVTQSLAQRVISISNERKVISIGDTKPAHAAFFKNVYLLTPNLKEAKEIAGIDDATKAGKKIQKQLNSNVLITEGSRGMTLFQKHSMLHFPTKAQEVFDVAGAGDTVVAGMALSLAAGANLEEAAIVANHAAGIVVGKIGTATISVEELKASLKNDG